MLSKSSNGSWVLFTISRNSLYQGLLYQGLSVLWAIMALTICNDSRENEFYGKVGTNYAHIHILIAFLKSRGHLNIKRVNSSA